MNVSHSDDDLQSYGGESERNVNVEMARRDVAAGNDSDNVSDDDDAATDDDDDNIIEFDDDDSDPDMETSSFSAAEINQLRMIDEYEKRGTGVFNSLKI